MPNPLVKYPRLIVSGRTHARVTRLAKRQKVTIAKLSNQIVIAGLKALGL